MEKENPRIKRLKRNITRELNGNANATNEIIETASKLNEKIGTADQGTRKGLLYGQVQSGKTNNMLATLSLAAESGHKLFIILTSDNLWLYQQTIDRVTAILPWFQTFGKDDWGNFTEEEQESELNNNGVILVSTKNSSNLPKLNQLVKGKLHSDTRPIIFDDEADQASLNTMTNNEQEELSKVNKCIVELRESFKNHVYIQVTATPQALLLQGADSDFAPDFTIKFDPGEGYVGGEEFFEEDVKTMREFRDEEIDSIMSEDGERGYGFAIPTGLRQALCSFLVGASVKLINEEGASYSFLCHVSHKKDDHKRLKTLIDSFIRTLSHSLNNDHPDPEKLNIARSYLNEAYLDLRSTHDSLPEFDEVLEEIQINIPSTQSQLLISGSNHKVPSYVAPFNILIGGNKLSRGVTIKGLLVSYYGRTSQAPKVDTLLQHARMYGYRANDMDVVRFYTSKSILDVFKNIYESEKQLRQVIATSDPSEMKALLLSRSKHSLIRPTRTNVIYLDSILFYKAGKSYFPQYPLSENLIVLDKILSQYKEDNQLKTIPIKEMKEIINLTAHEKTEGETWDKEAVKACLNYIDNNYSRGYIFVSENKDIKFGARAMLSPSDQNKYETDGPTLIMYRYNSDNTDKGWQIDDEPRWVPNLRFPDGKEYFMFSTTDALE
ncbi:DEAD/DEAH box helicase [Halobacillus andaensis]|uniref:DEAD/DEAH box helicase n=1 Tax=Halobacillus andaensis TaxID=1176239 RepID=A0A917EX39_HALAA|nr:Z1 domain-containing protein [Halobacillus andaensis]MBP2004915.1 hypothetical protein [Halobacillus andaensis]GGF17907.1 DEAD/DEAH box helicase [Halobacillus andaensis]